LITCPVCSRRSSESEEWCVECGWLLSQAAPGSTPKDEGGIEKQIAFTAFVILPERGSMALRKARTVIGREFGDILLPEDLNVSRIHLAIVADKGGLYVEDLRSSNGTLLNGVKIPPGRRYLLSDGDVVTAGDSPIKIELKGLEKEGEEPAGLYLVDEEKKKYRLRQGDNTVGRLPLNTITIESSPYVAREHAVLSLEQTPSGLLFLYLTDLGSSNGSFINQKPIPAHTRIRVHPNDEVTFADATFRVLEIPREED
jgi:pSer/pThr/pTyr-binding forkhead associated (FHA) protein